MISDLIIKKPSLTIKQISYRKTESIDIESFKNDLQKSALCQHCPDSLNELVNLYNTTLSDTRDAHAHVITETIKSRPLVPWYSVEIDEARRERRKAERKWRRTRCDSDLLTFKLKKNYSTKLRNKSRCEFYKSFIGENSSDQRKLLVAMKTLLNHTHEVPYPPFKDKLTFANEMGSYFMEKIDNIQAKLDNMASGLSSLPPSSNSCLCPCSIMDRFSQLSENDVRKCIESSAKKSCKLDPMPTPLVINCIDSLLHVITKIINLSLSIGYFSDEWKCAIVNPVLKKPGLDPIFKNYRPVSNLPYVSKLTEMAVYEQVHLHIETNNIYPLLQSPYRKQHSAETALLKVMNDILLKMNW